MSKFAKREQREWGEETDFFRAPLLLDADHEVVEAAKRAGFCIRCIAVLSSQNTWFRAWLEGSGGLVITPVSKPITPGRKLDGWWWFYARPQWWLDAPLNGILKNPGDPS